MILNTNYQNIPLNFSSNFFYSKFKISSNTIVLLKPSYKNQHFANSMEFHMNPETIYGVKLKFKFRKLGIIDKNTYIKVLTDF